jgi:zinc D-Ala-D-Ala carboxypeptidase
VVQGARPRSAQPGELDRVLRRKEHPLGRAVDFECPAFGTPYDVCLAIAHSDLPFQKLIWEHTWTHIGWPAPGLAGKREIYTLMPDGSYASGIVAREP